MSDQFTFDELNLFNWNQSVSIKSLKNPNFTSSQVSDFQYIHPLPDQRHEEEPWNLQEFNKKAQKKLKNRNNVKNFRQRKKIENQKIMQRLKNLQYENDILRSQKYCRNCKKPYGGYIQTNETLTQDQKQNNQGNSFDTLKGEGKQCFEFQKPIFYPKNQKQIPNRNGKIWIALGILMMVIGVHLYGFRGKDGYQDISISKIESKKIIDMYEGKAGDLGDYLDVKVKYRSKTNPKQHQRQHDIFKQIRIYHEYEKQQKQEDYSQRNYKRFEMVEQQRQKNYKGNQFEFQKQEEVKFHKDFVYAMQAQIDQIGQYI